MGMVTFEGPPPYGLLVEKAAEACAVDEKVEMTLLSAPAISPEPIPLKVQLTSAVAVDLETQLQTAAILAEQNSRKDQ